MQRIHFYLLIFILFTSILLVIFHHGKILPIKASVSYERQEVIVQHNETESKEPKQEVKCDHDQTMPALKQEIARKLVLLAKDVYKSKRYTRSGKANSLLLEAQHKMEELLAMVNIEQPVFESENETVTWEEVVCPEVYKGTKFGYPFYQTKGWDIQSCTNAPPLNKVLTVLLNFKSKQSSNVMTRVLKDFERFYPGLHVFVATDYNLSTELGLESLNLTLRHFSSKLKTPGAVWNTMIKDTSTPYVLIGRDIERVTWDIRLERQIRVAHYFGISVVGGAIRTPDGHWSHGCRQLSLKNYTLAYIEGYDMSRNSCLYCEHLNGPFVAKTSSMRDLSFYKFDEGLPKDVLFEDLFIRIRKNNHIAMACPDAMYFVEETESRKELKATWLPLVRKWELNRIHLHSKNIHAYSCTEAGISCSHKKGIAEPICCLENLAAGMSKLFEVCEKIGVIIESDTGNILGSVKFGGILPWEVDGDVCYLKHEHEDILKAKDMFSSVGYTLIPNNKKYFALKVPGWRIEMWGMPNLTTVNDLQEKINRTRVHTGGHWHIMPRNPGYFAIARYGNEVYKHSQSWASMGMGTSWAMYRPGSFSPCSRPGFHGCLDQYIGDGNIQFMGPWL